MNLHIDEERLELYALGRLEAQEAESAEEHLLVCEVCRTALVDTERFVRALRQLAKTEEERKLSNVIPFRVVRRPVVWAPAAIAAGLLLAVYVRPQFSGRGLEPAVLVLQPLRGVESGSVADPGRPLVLRMELPAPVTASYRVEVADEAGRQEIYQQVEAHQGRISWSLPGLNSGDHWVRVYGPGDSQELVREYRLHIR